MGEDRGTGQRSSAQPRSCPHVCQWEACMREGPGCMRELALTPHARRAQTRKVRGLKRGMDKALGLERDSKRARAGDGDGAEGEGADGDE
jgi:hypothetical protein